MNERDKLNKANVEAIIKGRFDLANSALLHEAVRDGKLTAGEVLQARCGAISTRMPEVAVEYDSRGARATKTFKDAYEARRFYVSKSKAGKNPQVKKVS